MFYYILF